MKFFIGALALAVILAIFGAPAVLLFGWGALTSSDRQAISRGVKSLGALDPKQEQQPREQARAGSSG